MCRVSVIIPTYNRASLLDKTLLSLTLQNFESEKMEVIVVDDGSNDNTLEIINKYKMNLNLKYFFQEDKGFRVAKARNVGIKNSKGKICIFLDSGIVVSRNFINEHLIMHNNKSDVVIGYVYGFSQINKHESDIINSFDINDIEKSIDNLEKIGISDLREALYRYHGDEIKDWPAPWVLGWGGNLSVNREFLIESGMYDENYTTWGGEDIDLALALFIKGAIYHLNRKASSIDYPHEKLNNYQKNPKEAYEDAMKKVQYLHEKYDNIQTHILKYIDTSLLNKYLIELRRYSY